MRGARLTLLCAVLTAAHNAWGDDVAIANGERAFHRHCAACHSIEAGQNKIGPSLHRVLGRPSAMVPDYRYSDALRRLDVTWTADKLEVYLADAQAFAPGSKMWVKLPDAKTRRDVITFLASSPPGSD